jgi:UDP-N-acetylmuramoyl-tripeptide--D-alanyl-D-alanine ligase
LEKYDPLVVGITGSVGKSTTKEAIYNVLSEKFFVRRNVSNYNNELGLPLSITGLKKPVGVLNWLIFCFNSGSELKKMKDFPTHLVLEMGADKKGDIAHLCALVKPMIGVITNVGESHMEFLGSKKGIMIEKRALIESLPKNGRAVLNFDDELVMKMKTKSKAKIMTYGLKKGSDVSAQNISIKPNGTSFKLSYNGSIIPVKIKLLGLGAVRAALAATAVGLAVDMDIIHIVEGLKKWQSLPGRMNLIAGKNNMVIIDDSYNASSRESIISGIESLKRMTVNSRKVAVLGSMWEMGAATEEGHREVGKRAARYFDIIIAVEENAKYYKEGALVAGMAENDILIFSTTDELLLVLEKYLQPGDLVYVKGSQGKNRLEKVVYKLMKDKHRAKDILVRQSAEWQK